MMKEFEGVLIYKCANCNTVFESLSGGRTVVTSALAATEEGAAERILSRIVEQCPHEYSGIRGATHRCADLSLWAPGESPRVIAGIARLVGVRILR